jgi:hypothetical protein
MSFSERRATLLRILEIEESIKDIEHSKEYLTMKRGLKVLENARSGGGVVIVSSPDDMSRTVEMRKNSADVEDCISKYKTKMQSNADKIESLNLEKSRLKKELINGS